LDLKDKLSLFKKLKNPKVWSGFFLSTTREIDKDDAEIIIEEFKKAG